MAMRPHAPDAPSGGPAAGDGGELDNEIARLRTAAGHASLAGETTVSEWSEDVETSRAIDQILLESLSMHNMSMRSSRVKRMEDFARASPATATASAVVGSLLDHHPRNRLPESARKFKISNDHADVPWERSFVEQVTCSTPFSPYCGRNQAIHQARLQKVLKAEIPARQMVHLLRETCRKLGNVGHSNHIGEGFKSGHPLRHAIVDTSEALAAGERSSQALVSLLLQIYGALAAPAEVSLLLLYSRYRS